MKHSLIVITNKQKLFICSAATVFIILIAIFNSTLNFTKVAQSAGLDLKSDLSLKNENRQIKNILSTIIPVEDKVLYEDSSRGIKNAYNSDKATIVQTSEVLAKGKNLKYVTVYTDENYLRPIYSSTWKQAYFRGWLYLPQKILNSRHSLFMYQGSSSNKFDLEGELGFYPNITVDTQNYLNFLIYNFDLQNVTLYQNQIVITGTPIKKGVQIISVRTEDVLPEADDSKKITAQLCTPYGYEIDYQNIQLSFSVNAADNYGNTDEAFDNSKDIADINSQNIQLKHELSNYISDSSSTIYFQHNGSYQTSDVLNSNIDLDNALACSAAVDYDVLYDNQKYLRPVYHPLWKQNYDKEWCYIPRKMYLNMKKLFVLPSDKNISADLCGELGFFEKYPEIKKGQVSLLLYNFSVKSVRTFEDNVLVTGVPSRTGIQVISVSNSSLKDYSEYAVRMLTKDLCEIDEDVIKR